MQIRQLELLIAVVDHQGVGKAAAALHITQPSVSQAIHNLETELRLPLFERSGRALRLTEPGVHVVSHARRALAELESLKLTATQARGLHAGNIRITAQPSLSMSPLPELIAGLQQNHPAITVGVTVSFEASDAYEAVRSAVADVALVAAHPPERTPGLQFEPLGTIEISLAAPPGTALPKGPVPIDCIRDLRFIAGVEGTLTRELLEEVRSSGVPVDVIAEVTNRDGVVPLILAGVGASFLADAYTDTARAGGATVRTLSPPRKIHSYLVHRPGPMSPTTAAFLEVARALRA